MEELTQYCSDLEYADTIYRIHIMFDKRLSSDVSYNKTKSAKGVVFTSKDKLQNPVYNTNHNYNEFDTTYKYMVFSPDGKGTVSHCYRDERSFPVSESLLILDDFPEELHFQYALIYNADQLRIMFTYWYLKSKNASKFYLDLEFMKEYKIMLNKYKDDIDMALLNIQ